MRSALRYVELNNLLLLGFIVVINTALIFWLTYKITTPLVELAEMADEVGRGKFDQEPIPMETDDEVGIVAAAFNRMIVSINGYIEKIRESAAVESRLREHDLMLTNYYKDAQLRSLQAQINPHFLFNTLNAGAQLAMMEGADETCSFMEKVADFFRYNIKKLNRNATLREELALVDSYAYILKVRLADHIAFRRSVDESCLDVDLPGMTLQPLVENALVHGFADSEQGGTIDIVVERAPSRVVVRVRDDGRGMTRERIESILANQESEPVPSPVGTAEELTKDGRAGSSTGIGLRNVITRLRLFYGLDDVVDIRSGGLGTGTEIQIKIPTKNDGRNDV
jgi:sensor histidine kinase YesM